MALHFSRVEFAGRQARVTGKLAHAGLDRHGCKGERLSRAPLDRVINK